MRSRVWPAMRFDLLRPDTYVALADGSGATSALDRYFAEQGIQLMPPSRNLA